MDNKCINCGLCRKNCEFLNKYQINIGDTERLKELAYHCFQCGKCTEVCPVGIDGKGIILELRRRQVKEKGKPEGYGSLLMEKENYLFKNYRHSGKSALFPGCSFPSFYPKTTEYLINEFEKHGIGVVFDCCGKPVSELGMEEKEWDITAKIEKRLAEKGVEELIVLCPNCYRFLRSHLKNVKIIGIYEKMTQLGIGRHIDEDVTVFMPCPDRKEKLLFSTIAPFVNSLTEMRDVQCCGLGGVGFVKEGQLSSELSRRINEKMGDIVYTYCASCAGNLVRNGGKDVRHLLVEISGTGEKPDSAGAFFNRAKYKFF